MRHLQTAHLPRLRELTGHFLILAWTVVALSAGAQAAAPHAGEPATVAEKSGFKRTGRYDEVQRLCASYQQLWAEAVRCSEFGRSPEGRALLALVVSRSGALTPEEAHRRNIPVMLAQAGIHAGEVDGKDAGFLALRELLRDQAAPGALRAFVFVFVPVFNVDGHERFGRWNRPNQVGPEEMGWRTTAQNLNLNRDYMKADAPEMRAMLRLLNTWDPVLYVDLHVTDGAQFQPDISNTLEPIYAGDPDLHGLGRAMLAELNGRLTQMGSKPLDFYPDFVAEDDPASGFAATPALPRFSNGYWDLHNRFALLVETHSWKDYPTRVRVTRNTLVTLADMTSREGSQWLAQFRQADQRAQQLGGKEVAVDFDNGSHVMTLDFPGYAYAREPSAVSGGLVTHYDTSKPQIWHIPYKDEVIAKTTVRAPGAGYIVPAAHAAWVGEKLTLHGVRFQTLDRPTADAEVEAFRATKVNYPKATFEGHTTMTFEGAWHEERQAVPAGSLFVPIAQPNSRLAVALLDPQAPDSLAAWGFFATAFEEKEYMEPYVAEQVAREMLAKDPKLAQEFAQKLAHDARFAADPAARLDFFYMRHPAYDRRLNLYPVYKADVAP